MSSFSIGIDLGGTNLRAAAFDASGNLLARRVRSSDHHLGPEAVVEGIGSLVDQLLSELPQSSGPNSLLGVGVGVPGIIDMAKGEIAISPNLQTLNGFPIKAAIERRLRTPVVLENDANAAAIGEAWTGAGLGEQDLVLLTLGTGVGGGIIANGQVMHGKSGMAAELGHMKVVPNGNPCGCGANGCLEKHASATAVIAMARTLGIVDPDPEMLNQLATKGDASALMIWQTMGGALGVALANLINIFDFPLYILSGGVLPAWQHFAPAMMAEIERSSYVYRHSRPRIEAAKLGGDAGLYGAGWLGLNS
jgi:glucokinase